MEINRLVINKSKSHYILIGDKAANITINSFGLTQTTKVKVLGVTINNHLSFDPHIDGISKQLSKWNYRKS
jgi:hypothetical protein